MIATILITLIFLSVVGYFIWKRFLKREFEDFVVRDNERIKKELEKRNKVVEFTESDRRVMFPLTPDECYKPQTTSKNRSQQTEENTVGNLTHIVGNDYFFDNSPSTSTSSFEGFDNSGDFGGGGASGSWDSVTTND